ncbi:MAG: hypothetical protein LBD70_04495 [Bifidobacteriaceae bacterium]|jgi:hypothetical protein|nr:hypothetical protein [Bifidobacteriaceae bacterium]
MPQIKPADFSTEPMPAQEVTARRGDLLGQGGQARVYRDKLDPRVALKLYNDARSLADLIRVKALIRMCSGLDNRLENRVFLDSLNLPIRPLLDRAGDFRGVALPIWPDETLGIRFEWRDGKPRRTSRKAPFEAQHLMIPQSYFGPVDRQRQFGFLVEFAKTIRIMHGAGLAHGDLSSSNVLVRRLIKPGLSGEGAYLIDLDEAFPQGIHAVRAYRRSRKFYDPYTVADQRVDVHTDVFMLALWTTSFILWDMLDGEKVAKRFPDEAARQLKKAAGNDGFKVVRAALGRIGGRPPLRDLQAVITHIHSQLPSTPG